MLLMQINLAASKACSPWIRPHRPCWPNGRSEYLCLSPLQASSQRTVAHEPFRKGMEPKTEVMGTNA